MKRFPITAAVAAVLLTSVVACESTPQAGDPTLDVGGGPGPATPAPAADAAPSSVIDAGTFAITSSRPAFQTKSTAQLLNSLTACFGPASLMITADMIQGGSATAPVLGTSFAVSTAVGVNDIVTVQTSSFDGDASLLRLGTRADALSLEYVTAQRNVANVIAKNCTSAGASPLCACATLPDATAMARRCLPQFDPSSGPFLAAAQQLQTRCSTKQGEAIGSFVASAALSKLP